MVSAGESVEVTLPRNEVELNAFVVPTPPAGKTMEMSDLTIAVHYLEITLKLVTHCHFSSFLTSAELSSVCCRF